MPLAQMLCQLRQCHAVEYPFGRHATFTGHLNPPVSKVEFTGGVSVRIDAHKAAKFERSLVPPPVEIKPPRMGVDLDRDAMAGARFQHFLNIDVVPWPTEQLPPCHVAYDGCMWIGDRPNNALGLAFNIQSEAAVNTGNHEIETGQNIVRIIETAVNQNIGLNSL